jgi:oxaloacetate decarboxylase alpha subunit/pyruvate carboxylase subunit B
MLSLLENHPRCPQYDLGKLQELREHFTKVYAELDKFTAHKNEVVDTDALTYQVPGGMLSNFRNQLKEQKMEDRFEEVFAEIPVVRKALGWIPLVTPTSQIVGVQAMLNVKFGRWKNFSPQAMDIALGYYGQTPADVDPEVQKIAADKSGKDPIDCRPADLAEPAMDRYREELKKEGLPADDEHCVIWAMFPQELKKHHASKVAPAEPKQETVEVPAAAAAPAAAAPASSAGGKVSEVRISINGKNYNAFVEEIPQNG